MLSYIYSYLTNPNQCVCINDKKGNFQKIISGVPRGSTTGPILFNSSKNDLFFVSSASMYSFNDDNSLFAIANTVAELKNTLQSESEVVPSWSQNNKIVNYTNSKQ